MTSNKQKEHRIQVLSNDELIKLANRCGIKKFDKAWLKTTTGKNVIRKILFLNCTNKDIDLVVSTGKSKNKGKDYETFVMDIFEKKGYCCKNLRRKGAEYDIVGHKTVKSGGWGKTKKKWVIVECKNKLSVTGTEVSRFIGVIEKFKRSHRNVKNEDIKTYLYYTGSLSEGAKSNLRGSQIIKKRKPPTSH